MFGKGLFVAGVARGPPRPRGRLLYAPHEVLSGARGQCARAVRRPAGLVVLGDAGDSAGRRRLVVGGRARRACRRPRRARFAPRREEDAARAGTAAPRRPIPTPGRAGAPKRSTTARRRAHRVPKLPRDVETPPPRALTGGNAVNAGAEPASSAPPIPEPTPVSRVRTRSDRRQLSQLNRKRRKNVVRGLLDLAARAPKAVSRRTSGAAEPGRTLPRAQHRYAARARPEAPERAAR